MQLALLLLIAVLCSVVSSVATASDELLPRLHGTVISTEFKMASMVPPGAHRGDWFAEGQMISGYRLLEISAGKVLLGGATGEKVTVYLIGAKISEEENSSAAGEAKPFSRKWINSHENPMLLSPLPIASEIAKRWSQLSKEERDKLAQFYLNHGWRMLRVEFLSSGGLTVEWEDIYANERKQVILENRASFVASLNPEQKALWDQLAASRRIMVVGGALTAEQKAEVARLEALSAAFRKKLSPQQEQARATIDDFTKGKW